MFFNSVIRGWFPLGELRHRHRKAEISFFNLQPSLAAIWAFVSAPCSSLPSKCLSSSVMQSVKKYPLGT